MILRPLFCFEVRKNTGWLIFTSLKQKKLILNFFVNRNWKKLTDSRKRTEILADNRKSHHAIETLIVERAKREHAWKSPHARKAIASWIWIILSDFLFGLECDGFLQCFVTLGPAR